MSLENIQNAKLLIKKNTTI